MSNAAAETATCPACDAALTLAPQRCEDCDCKLAVVDGALVRDTTPVLDLSPRGKHITAYSTGPMTEAKAARIAWVRKNGRPSGPGWTGKNPAEMTDVQILAAFADADWNKAHNRFMRSIEQ